MPSKDVIALLGGWEGYRIGTVARFEAGELSEKSRTPEVLIGLIRRRGPMICLGCGQTCNRVQDWEERWVRDLPALDAQTHLCLQRFRVAWPTCGPKLERLSWLPLWSRVTLRLAESVARLCKVLPIKHVAEFHELGWDAVKGIDKPRSRSRSRSSSVWPTDSEMTRTSSSRSVRRSPELPDEPFLGGVVRRGWGSGAVRQAGGIV